MDDFVKSTKYLKSAVPLMIKYQIPTTPSNYALWYTYVAQTNEQLNQAIDRSISETGICSSVTSDQLYQLHLANHVELNADSAKSSLEAIATELQSTMKDTLGDTEQFQLVLDKSFSQLSRLDNEGLSLDEMTSHVRTLIQNAGQIGQSTRFFKDRLSDAEKEISDLKAQIEQVRKEAYQDAMTGVLNRRAFDQELMCMMNSKQTFSLIMADIDLFKPLNDQFGHLFGDQVLKVFSKRLEENCKQGERCYRIGGEEFAILLPNKKLAVARQFAEALRRAIEKISVTHKQSNQRINQITASFGVAEMQPSDTKESLIDRADAQLYKAKQLGRNRVMPMSL